MTFTSSKKVLSVVIILAAISILVFGIVISFDSEKIQTTIGKTLKDTTETLPTIYIVHKNYKTPFFEYNNTFISSVIDLVETAYKYFGYQTNYLPSDQYIKFSRLYFELKLNEFMNTASIDNETRFNSTSFYNLYLTSKSFIRSSIVPYGYCIDANCSKTHSIPNPIAFDLLEPKFYQTVSDFKNALYEYEKPVLISFSIPMIGYYIPDYEINDTLIYNINMLDNITECPSHILYDESRKDDKDTINKCYYIKKTAMYRDRFYLPKSPAFLEEGDIETYMLMGWNDELVGSSYTYADSDIPGGFILRTSKYGTGSLIEYLSGNARSYENDDKCLLATSPYKWLPMNIDCMKNSNISSCNKTVLLCRNITGSSCDNNYSYSLLSSSSFPILTKEVNGFHSVILAQFNDTYYTTLNSYLTLDELSNVFYVNETQTIDQHCSYIVLPYNVVDEIRLNNWNIFGTVNTIKWTKESYPKSAYGEKLSIFQMSTFPFS